MFLEKRQNRVMHLFTFFVPKSTIVTFFAMTAQAYPLSRSMVACSDREKSIRTGIGNIMTDTPKVKASKAVDDARVASHVTNDDAKLLAHNTLKDAKTSAYSTRNDAVKAQNISDKFNIHAHQVDSRAKISAHESQSESMRK